MAEGAPPSVPQTSSSVRNWLIGATLFVLAAIIFGILYLFVIAPTVPSGSVGWFLFSFATGLTMIIMPCTLPLAFVIVPLSMGKGLVRGLSIAVAFGLGVAATLSLYGIIAAVVGDAVLQTLGADLETLKNWVYFIAGMFALVFALSEIGLLNFHMPTYSGAAPAFIQKQQEVIKAFFLGLFLGNVGVGCPHPATPLILIEIATSGDVLYGWLMFLIHAIGRILPLLLLAFLAILGVNGLNWLMTRKAVLERVTGWAMVFVAGFILTLGLFSHDWWVNSGIHSALEALTQESRFNTIMNDTLGTNVAHVHGLETGVGLFGQPLEWGNWFLVLVWLVPMWWWFAKRRKAMHESPAFKIRTLEEKIDRLEKDRRQVESMVKLDELETSYDLAKTYEEVDELERLRRLEESKVEYGETGVYKNPVAREYENRILGIRRNYLIVISAFLILTFVYFLPKNFYYKSLSGVHDDHAAVTTQSGTPASSGSKFSTETRDLPPARESEFVTLQSGDTYTITASYVQKRVGNRSLRMLAYNGSVPGPFITVPQGGTINVVFVNNTDIDQTIHSHGLRGNNLFDGVPGSTQDPVKPGETYTYVLEFPDAGVAWYHPHTRDDYGQEMGLYGNYFVESSEEGYDNPVNRELPIVLDDILIENGQIAAFYKEHTDHALLGRFGNQYLVNGEIDYTVEVDKGEVVRLLMTNVSNARTYRLSVPGALVKKVAADLSKFEMETFSNEVVISPAERLVLEVYFPEAGTYKLLNRMNGTTEEVARFAASDASVSVSHRDAFLAARKNIELENEFASIRNMFVDAPQKRIRLTVALNGEVNHSAHAHGATSAATTDGHAHDHGTMMMQHTTGSNLDAIQWNDPGNTDVVNTTENVTWIITDEMTGKQSMNIPVSDWTFKQGSLVKIRITNDAMAAHVMQHPIHLHGQRFVVLSENGVMNTNMAWKDTALVLPGEYMDIVVDMSTLGEWMLHCHISEHLHAGMMMPFRVEDQNGYATGDEYRLARTGTTAGAPHQPAPVSMPGTSAVDTNAGYTFTDTVSDVNGIHADKNRYKVNTPEYVAFSFTDPTGSPLRLSSTMQTPLKVTFVSRDGTDHFVTYPGNTQIHMRQNMNTNVPGTPGFDEAKPHMHSLKFIETAYADAGHAHGDLPVGPTYSVPVQFSTMGEYKAFVEYYLEGETTPRIGSLVLTVGSASWSVDNYGWSQQFKWWMLLIISILIMVPLSLYVHRYINKEIV